MKKLIQTLFAAFLVVGISSVTLAQNTDNDNITASANVLGTITVTGTSQLDFGDINVNSSETIAPNESGSGKFTVDAANSSNVTLSLTYPSTSTTSNTGLTGVNHSDELDIAFSSAWDANEDLTQGTAPGNSFTNSTTLSAFDGTGGTSSTIIGVWVGGNASAASDQAPGDYTGTITLEATYN